MQSVLILRAARFFFVLGVAAIVALSLDVSGAVTAPGGDKLHHFLAYFAVSACGFHGFGACRMLPVFAFMIALGAALEIAQMTLTATRVGDWADLAADGLGVALAALCVGALARFAGARRLARAE